MSEKTDTSNILENLKITYFCPQCFLHSRDCKCAICNSAEVERTEWGKCSKCGNTVIISVGDSKMTFCESCGDRL